MAPRRKSSAKKRKAEELQNGAGPSAAPAAPAAEEEKSEEELLQEALGMLMGALQNSIDADKYVWLRNITLPTTATLLSLTFLPLPQSQRGADGQRRCVKGGGRGLGRGRYDLAR
jgi:hypothetical protein